jgi:hypothetical protein
LTHYLNEIFHWSAQPTDNEIRDGIATFTALAYDALDSLLYLERQDVELQHLDPEDYRATDICECRFEQYVAATGNRLHGGLMQVDFEGGWLFVFWRVAAPMLDQVNAARWSLKAFDLCQWIYRAATNEKT